MQERSFITKVERPFSSGRFQAPFSGIPPVFLKQATGRLRVLSLVFGLLFTVSWLLPNFLERRLIAELTSSADWIPASVVILSSALVYLLSRSARFGPQRMILVGLAYQVIVSFALAFIQYWGAFRGVEARYLSFDRAGLTTVAIWMMLFTVVVPNRPLHARVALLLSASATPIVYALSVAAGDAPHLPAFRFFFTLIFPYLIVSISSFIAASIIYRLGTEIRRAQEMGSYRLEERLGAGGMGEVWRARHAMLARPAAVKLIRRDALGGDESALGNVTARFEREAQATAGLQSAHTVDLYDFGTSHDGTLFYVMELLDGVDLQTLVERYGPSPPERVVHILLQACDSLAEAHARGLVHRDIKPANIYLCQYALEHDFVKVLDFGLVKRRANVEGDGRASLTQGGVVAGTPAFLAPELALGQERVDGRADLYALGCIAYWLLTGRLVFEEESPMGMIAAHIKNAPTPPSRLAETAVPEALDRVILDCLAKKPSERPASARDLARRLRGLSFVEEWTPERAEQWWARHRPTAADARP